MNELQKALEEAKALHIADVVRSLRQDPLAELTYTNESKLTKYLTELADKDDSLCKGLIYALETYLEK